MKQDESMFATEAALVSPVDSERPSTLFLRVQNISSSDIWVLHDVTTILVPNEIDDDGINDVHFDFGSNPEAQYLKLDPNSWIEFQVLVEDVFEEMVLQVMKVRAPVTVRYRYDSHAHDSQVVLLTFNINQKVPGSQESRPDVADGTEGEKTTD